MGKIYLETTDFAALVQTMEMTINAGQVPGWKVKKIDKRPCFTFTEVGEDHGWFWPDSPIPSDERSSFSLVHGNQEKLTHELSIIYRDQFINMLNVHFEGYFEGPVNSTIF